MFDPYMDDDARALYEELREADEIGHDRLLEIIETAEEEFGPYDGHRIADAALLAHVGDEAVWEAFTALRRYYG